MGEEMADDEDRGEEPATGGVATDDQTDRGDTDEETSETGRLDEEAAETELPDAVVSEAERLTRLARAVDGEEATAYRERRAETLAEHDYVARLREDDETLVLYPEEWLAGDTVDLHRIRDTSRALEVPLSASAGEAGFEAVEQHNAALVEAVEAEYGAVHAANGRAFADFMGNHYLGRVEEATAEHLEEFREEYYRRNVWPSAEQAAVLEASLRHLFAVADRAHPADREP